jgi:hypothetical protein
LLPVLALGCAGSFEEAQSPGVRLKLSAVQSAECHSLDNQRIAWDATGKTSAALAGASGLAMIPWGDDKTARTALAGGIVAAGAVAVGAEVVAQGKGAAWVRECQQ